MYQDGMPEDRMYEGEMMKRGGRKRRGKKPSKATQQQIVNVKVKVGDTVQLMKGRPAPHYAGMGDFRLLQGVGAKFANPPLVQLPSSYGIYPASKAPMYNDSIRVGGGAQYNMNRADDIANSTLVNPYGIAPDMRPSKRAVPSRDMFADRRVNYEIMSQLPMRSADPSRFQVPDQSPSRRAEPSQPASGYASMRLPRSLGDVIGAFQQARQQASSSLSADPELQPDLHYALSDVAELQQLPGSEEQVYDRLANMGRGGGVF